AVPQHLWRPIGTLRAELPLDDALTVMRRAASHLAAVADASGKVLGLVALEDVLEMLVGEVRDPAHRGGTRDRVAEPRGELAPSAPSASAASAEDPAPSKPGPSAASAEEERAMVG
ncbi:CBS domain-containing protein, partial [Streptomyces sp. MCAF7]